VSILFIKKHEVIKAILKEKPDGKLPNN